MSAGAVAYSPAFPSFRSFGRRSVAKQRYSRAQLSSQRATVDSQPRKTCDDTDLVTNLDTKQNAALVGRRIFSSKLLFLLDILWLRGQDLNLRPLGYEPNELPGCSTPRLEDGV